MSIVIATALIRKLNIQRFRGLENFEWCPEPGMNVVLGGGDVGKSTVLEAVALLLSPSNATVVSESDYWQRDSTQEFVIEAVMALTAETGISSMHNFSWPWTWNGKDAMVPSASADDDMPPADDPVYRVRVRGTTELDLVWEIVQPHDAADHFSLSIRRKIGLVRLSADEKNDRDLRLVYGSALDRMLADTALRAHWKKSIRPRPARITECRGHESDRKTGQAYGGCRATPWTQARIDDQPRTLHRCLDRVASNEKWCQPAFVQLGRRDAPHGRPRNRL
jgi:putative ATP-dependent endonuclease of the OLD family